jgi:hypothetical protein
MRRIVSIGVVLLASLMGGRGRADETGSKAVADSDRQLAGHVFTPSSYVLTPFSTMAFGSTSFFASGTARSVRDIRNHAAGTISYDLVGFSQGFDFSGRINKALSIRAAASFTIYSGADGKAVLVAGVSGSMYGSIGVTLGQTFVGPFRAAVTMDVAALPQYDLLIANAVLDALQGVINSNDLFVKGRRISYQPGISLAYAPHKAFGLIGQAAFVTTRRESGSGTKERSGTQFGISGDFDMEQLWHVPIALTAVYSWQGAGGLTRLQNVGGGVWYTRRVPLQLGLEVVWREQALRPDIQGLPLKATVATIVFRYYW